MVMLPGSAERPWWEREDPGGIAGEDGLDPLDLGPPPSLSPDSYAPRLAPAQPSFIPIEPDYRFDMPAVLAQLRREIPAVPRSAGFFERMSGSFFDLTGDLVGLAITALAWSSETTERLAGLFYWNDIPLGDRWSMGKLTWEQFGFGKGAQREEILRRYRSGEQIDKIAEDFEGSMSDLVMSMIADPLNAFGVPGLGLLAKASDAAKLSRVSRALRAADKGLILPRFSLRKPPTADDLLSGAVKGARPASNFLTRGLRDVGLNQTADERIIDRANQMFGQTRTWGVNPEDAVKVARNWRMRGVHAPFNMLRLTNQARAVEAKQSGHELLTRLVRNPLVSHEDMVQYQDEIIGGAWNGRLLREHADDWLVPGTQEENWLQKALDKVLFGVHPNPPQGVLVMDAARAEATAQGLDAARVFRETHRRPWFEGTEEEFLALPAKERKKLFQNREQWEAKFMEEWVRFSEGDGKVAGAIDHYFGMGGADVVLAPRLPGPLGGVAPGYIRLYRAEPVGAVGRGEFDDPLKGSWFSDDLELTELIAARHPGVPYQIYRVDVTRDVAAKAKRALPSGTEDAYGREYILGDKFASEKQAVLDIESERRALQQRQNPRVQEIKSRVQAAKKEYAEARAADRDLPWGWNDKSLHPVDPIHEEISRRAIEAKAAYYNAIFEMDAIPTDARFLEDAGGTQLVVIPRELNDLEKLDRQAQALQGQYKWVLGMAFLNKPPYIIGNFVTNFMMAIGRIGKGIWRNSDADEARLGADLVRSIAYDVGRSGYQAIKEAPPGPTTWKSALKGALLSFRPFANLANAAPGIGDVDLRRRLVVETVGNVMKFNMTPSDLSPFGVLKPIQWADDVPSDEQRLILSRLQNTWTEPELRAWIAELDEGIVKAEPVGYLLQRVLEDGGLEQAQAVYLKNLLGDKYNRELGEALAAARDPTEARHVIDRVAADIDDLSYQFMGDVPLPIYRTPSETLREARAKNSLVIRRFFKGVHAAGQRVMDVHGIRDDRFEKAMFGLTKKLEAGQLEMYTKLDNDLSPYAERWVERLATAEGRAAYRTERTAIFDAYGVVRREAFKEADALIKPLLTKPEVRKWWTSFRERWRTADAAIQAKQQAVIKSLGDDWVYISDAAPEWRAYFTYRDTRYQKLLDDTYKELRMTPLPDHVEPITEEGIDIAHMAMRFKDETREYLGKMASHADELFEPLRREVVDGVEQVVEWGPRRFEIDPRRAAEYRRYLEEDVLPDLRVLQTVALRAGRAMADDAVLSYSTRYGFDKTLTYAAPYAFWPTRMAHRWVRAAQARPGAAAGFAKLIDAQMEMQDDLPERLRKRLRIPVPFLPDWMGANLFFDPIRYFFPPGQNIGEQLEGESNFGTFYNWAQTVGATPTPIVSVPLQMSGILGERDSYVRTFFSGGPWLMPGTAAQRAIYGFLRGAPPSEWADEPEAWDTIALGDSFPEPLIRKVLGLKPGDDLDGYRVLRALASGSVDGSWTAEEAVRAMQRRAGPVWQKGVERAETEAGIREISGWLGAPVTIYPEGERIQNGLQAMFSVARDMDRQSGKDEMVDAFYQNFPEFQARSIQRAWYRGTQAVEAEADTAAYYIDLGEVKEKYDPQIEYVQGVMDEMPPMVKPAWKARLGTLYDERSQLIDRLSLKYPRRKTAPSLSAAPHDRALSYLREQYYGIKGDSYQNEKTARELFLSRLRGRGQASSYYKLAVRRDELFAQFSQRLVGASRFERDDIYEERKRAIEALTEQAIPDISRQDFEDYLGRGAKEPEDEEVERQRRSDLLTTLFSSTDAIRALREHPELAEHYGATPDPVVAGHIDSWWAWYDALPPNSRARDDYVEMYLPQLNSWRALVGLPELSPRLRPTAGPLVEFGDPYEQAIAAAEAEMP